MRLARARDSRSAADHDFLLAAVEMTADPAVAGLQELLPDASRSAAVGQAVLAEVVAAFQVRSGESVDPEALSDESAGHSGPSQAAELQPPWMGMAA